MSKKPAASAAVPAVDPAVEAARAASMVTFALELRVVVDPTAGPRKPTVRFKWLIGGERITCGPVSEGEWKPADAASPAAGFVWRKEWAPFFVTEDFCKELNANPFVYLFIGDGPAGPGDASPARSWLSHVALDCSALLDGDVAVELSTGSASGQPAAPPPFSQFSVRLTVNKPLLTPELRLSLNPLAITLGKCAGLPGIVLPDGVDPKMLKFVQPNKFAVLNKVCAPVFAVYRLFDGDDQPRVVRCAPVSQGATAAWSAKSVFLLGSFTEADVTEHFLTKPLKIEVHDRARVGDSLRQRFPDALQAGWEALLKDGMNVFDADETVIRAIDAGLVTAGDNNAHGVATVWLSSLLSRAGEKLSLLKQSIAHQEAVADSTAAAAARAKAAEKEERRAARAAALAKLGIAAADGTPSSPGGSAAGLPPAENASGSSGEGFEPQWKPGDVPISLDVTADVLAAKRRVIPKGGSSEWRLLRG